MEEQTKKSFIISVFYYAIIGALVYLLFKFFLQYLLPVIIAVAVALIARKITLPISEKTKLLHSVCSVTAVVLIFIASISVMALSVYGIFSFVKAFFGDFENIGKMIKEMFENLRQIYSGFLHKISPEIAGFFEAVGGDLIYEISSGTASAVSGLATEFLKKIPSLFLSFAVALVAGCYIAKDYVGWTGFLKGITSTRFQTVFGKLTEVFKGSIAGLIKGYVILWIITYTELTVGFFILGVKFAPIIALLVAFVDLLPIFGTGTVLVPWAVADLIVGNTYTGIGLIILYILITLIRNFAEPKIIGSQIGINPLLTLIAMFAGLRLFGFWGLIIFPLALITVIKYYKAQMKAE